MAAGVDEINHLPGFRPDENVPIDRYRITDEDARAAAAAGIVVVTTGGAASWEDLSLYLIERFCGRTPALRTAKVYLFGDRTEGQLPFAAMTRPRRHEDAAVAASQTWIADHYAACNPVARMAERSGLGERTFKRRFTEATGMSPLGLGNDGLGSLRWPASHARDCLLLSLILPAQVGVMPPCTNTLSPTTMIMLRLPSSCAHG